MQEPISTPTDVQVQAQMFWLSASFPVVAGAHSHSTSAFRRSRGALQAASQRPDHACARCRKTNAAGGSKPLGFLHSAGRYGDRGFLGRNCLGDAVRNSQRAVGGAVDRADAWRKRDRDPALENPGPWAGGGDRSQGIWIFMDYSRFRRPRLPRLLPPPSPARSGAIVKSSGRSWRRANQTGSSSPASPGAREKNHSLVSIVSTRMGQSLQIAEIVLYLVILTEARISPCHPGREIPRRAARLGMTGLSSCAACKVMLLRKTHIGPARQTLAEGIDFASRYTSGPGLLL